MDHIDDLICAELPDSNKKNFLIYFPQIWCMVHVANLILIVFAWLTIIVVTIPKRF